MKVEGGFIVDAPIDRVWRAIRDPDVVAPCIPGCQSVESLGANSYKTSVRVALGPIATTFNATVEITDEEPPKRLACVTRGEEGGKASSLSAQSELLLTEVDGGRTQIRYSSEASIFGRLGRYGLGMMKKKADAVGAEFATAFTQRVAAMVAAEKTQ
jgi:carbon monoxide dehydrogenase subunit G